MKRMKLQKHFTLRLGPIEISNLEKLKKDLGITTDTGTIKYILNNFESLNSRYLEEKKQKQLVLNTITQVQDMVKYQKDIITDFCSAFNKLKDVSEL